MLHDLVDAFSWADLGDKAIRTVAVYATLLVLLRLAGKRQLAQLSTFDFVVILLLSNVVQNAIIGNETTLVGGLVGAAILIAINFVVVFFAFLNPRIERDLRGRETVLVADGKVKQEALRRELISRSELEAALRRQGFRGLGMVENVVLEPEGTLEVTEQEHASIRDVLAALERIERRLGTAPPAES
jgi:uncharacterized membrane protein YcaP (DUF421 family)